MFDFLVVFVVIAVIPFVCWSFRPKASIHSDAPISEELKEELYWNFRISPSADREIHVTHDSSGNEVVMDKKKLGPVGRLIAHAESELTKGAQ